MGNTTGSANTPSSASLLPETQTQTQTTTASPTAPTTATTPSGADSTTASSGNSTFSLLRSATNSLFAGNGNQFLNLCRHTLEPVTSALNSITPNVDLGVSARPTEMTVEEKGLLFRQFAHDLVAASSTNSNSAETAAIIRSTIAKHPEVLLWFVEGEGNHI